MKKIIAIYSCLYMILCITSAEASKDGIATVDASGVVQSIAPVRPMKKEKDNGYVMDHGAPSGLPPVNKNKSLFEGLKW